MKNMKKDKGQIIFKRRRAEKGEFNQLSKLLL
jgi:hypothetical protein